MRALATHLALLALLALVAGCRASVPAGRFACTTDLDCPAERPRCIGGRCHGVEVDGGSMRADGAVDATVGPDDDAYLLDAHEVLVDARDIPDAGRDAALDAGPVSRVRILAAVEDDGGAPLPSIRVSIGGESQPLAAFGCVTTFEGVPHGNVTIGVEVDGMPSTLPPVSIMEDSLIVLGRAYTGSLVAFRTADRVPTGSAAPTLRYLNLLRVGGSRELSIVMGTDLSMLVAVPVPFGTWSADADAAPTGPAAVGVTYRHSDASDRLLTSFTFLTPRDALVVLTGNAELHPATRGGPRALVVPLADAACPAPVLPDAQITAVHLSRNRAWLGGPTAYFCQLDVGSLGGTAVSPETVSATTSTFLGLSRFGLASSAAAACDVAAARVFDTTALGAAPGRRYLAVLHGTLGPDARMWSLAFLEEQPPPDVAIAGATQRVTQQFAHLARASTPGSIDIDEFPLSPVAVTGLAIDGSVPIHLPAGEVGGNGYEISDTGASTPLARFVAPGAAPGGAFTVLFDFDAPAVQRRLAHVRTPYTAPWSLVVRAPM